LTEYKITFVSVRPCVRPCVLHFLSYLPSTFPVIIAMQNQKSVLFLKRSIIFQFYAQLLFTNRIWQCIDKNYLLHPQNNVSHYTLKNLQQRTIMSYQNAFKISYFSKERHVCLIDSILT